MRYPRLSSFVSSVVPAFLRRRHRGTATAAASAGAPVNSPSIKSSPPGQGPTTNSSRSPTIAVHSHSQSGITAKSMSEIKSKRGTPSTHQQRASHHPNTLNEQQDLHPGNGRRRHSRRHLNQQHPTHHQSKMMESNSNTATTASSLMNKKYHASISSSSSSLSEASLGSPQHRLGGVPNEFNEGKLAEGLKVELPTAFDRGVFQTLPNDGTTASKTNPHQSASSPNKRSGFDRLVQTQLAPDLWLFGVIDGHGLSSLCAEYLYEAFPIVIQLLIKNTERGKEDGENDEDNFYLGVLREAFNVCAKEWDKSAPKDSLDHERLHSGAVAIMVLVKGRKCYLANAGDCRAVASDPDGTFSGIHELHRTDNPHERLRVINRGGRIRTVKGIMRVQGALMPTRAFGDISVRMDFRGNLHDFVNPDPDLTVVEPERDITEKHGKAYMIIASDGLWDSLDDTQITVQVEEALRTGKNAEEVAEELGETAARQTDDDVSIVVLVW